MDTDVEGSEADWEHYHETMRSRRSGPGNGEDVRAYIPTPKEVRLRIRDLKWLQELDFNDMLQDSIMINDCPTVDTVRRMVKSVGLKETKRRLTRFIKDEKPDTYRIGDTVQYENEVYQIEKAYGHDIYMIGNEQSFCDLVPAKFITRVLPDEQTH